MNSLTRAIALVLAASASAAAQEPSHPTITVSASGKVDKTPSALQFSFQIGAKGDDLAKAVEALEAKRKAAEAKMKALGVDEKDVACGAPSLEKKDPNQSRVEMMRRQSSNRLKKKKEEDKGAKEPVGVTLSITARLPLTAKEKGALFVESEKLKERIKAAKLFEKEKQDAEAEGEEDEMAARMMQYQQEQGLEDGFAFLFWAPVDPKDTQTAAAKAMENATKLALAGAQASGRALGAASNVEVNEGGGSTQIDEYYYYQRRRGYSVPAPDTKSEGIVSQTADSLQVSVMLKVTFVLK